MSKVRKDPKVTHPRPSQTSSAEHKKQGPPESDRLELEREARGTAGGKGRILSGG